VRVLSSILQALRQVAGAIEVIFLEGLLGIPGLGILKNAFTNFPLEEATLLNRIDWSNAPIPAHFNPTHC
jgi:hypothetical protein